MRITLCVDALQPELSGIGRYTWELWKGLERSEKISELFASHGSLLIDRPERLLRDPKYRPGPKMLRWFQRWRTRSIHRSTIVHAPNYFLPRSVQGGIITVHDLSVLRHPEAHPASRVKSFERLFASSVGRAAHIITDTNTVRQEVIEAFSLRPDQVSAVPLGVDPRFRAFEDADLGRALARFGLSAGRYGLSVAALEPRKKIAQLISAWRRLPSATRNRYPLVLAGGAGWENADLRDQIVEAQAEGWLRYLGFVDESVLPQLYAGARLFVYPSIYEGFGLPPIEAMASGTPVVASDRSCLPEVCGNAARLIDPDDPDRFVAAIEESLDDEEWQGEAVARGLERAKAYTWERCVAGTVAIYRTISTQSD